VAISLITEAHCGMQFPWMLGSMLPAVFAGPKAHDRHHQNGKKNFQKFFVYLDTVFNTLDKA
jgi:sterol desaturase/sphingolipid hydroxylase (fatty acid hydroxylase superfamily)